MHKIRIGGVPEHFNLPIHLAIENGLFSEAGLEVQWHEFEGGTGQMTQALRNDEVDLCILLTEGIITDIIKGNPSKLISIYVKTPLCWGVHTGSKNTLKEHSNIFDKKYAISRFGSGSHLMALVDAHERDIQLNPDQFVIINNLKNAINSLTEGETDVFYWEKFTTKPYVDQGILRRLGEYFSPWPCFVIAATENIISSSAPQLKRTLKIIHQSCSTFMADNSSPNLVSKRYGLEDKDAFKWFHATEWATDGWISNKMLNSTMSNLQLAGIIDHAVPPNELVWLRS